jgi:hypothetical protein
MKVKESNQYIYRRGKRDSDREGGWVDAPPMHAGIGAMAELD